MHHLSQVRRGISATVLAGTFAVAAACGTAGAPAQQVPPPAEETVQVPENDRKNCTSSFREAELTGRRLCVH